MNDLTSSTTCIETPLPPYLTKVDGAVLSEEPSKSTIVFEPLRQTVHKQCLRLQVFTRLHSIVCKVHSETAHAHDLCCHLLFGHHGFFSASKLNKTISLAETTLRAAHHQTPQNLAVQLKQLSQLLAVKGIREVSHKEKRVWVPVGGSKFVAVKLGRVQKSKTHPGSLCIWKQQPHCGKETYTVQW